MRSFPKRIISLFMAVFIALSCFCISVSAVESDIPEGNGNMYLDVVFVLDSSGSMLESDPNRVAADAFSLFVDLCDDTCGVGYTIYSHIRQTTDIGRNSFRTGLEKTRTDCNFMGCMII